MPRACGVCSHSKLAELTKAIGTKNGSLRTIASRFGLKHNAVLRHKTNCMGIKPKRQSKGVQADGSAETDARSGAPDSVRFASEGKISGPADLLKILGKLFRLGGLMDAAEKRGDVDAVVKLAREQRASVEAYAKVAGWIQTGTNVNIDNSKHLAIEGLSEGELRAIRAMHRLSTSVDGNANPVMIQALPTPQEGTE